MGGLSAGGEGHVSWGQRGVPGVVREPTLGPFLPLFYFLWAYLTCGGRYRFTGEEERRRGGEVRSHFGSSHLGSRRPWAWAVFGSRAVPWVTRRLGSLGGEGERVPRLAGQRQWGSF